MKRLLFLAPAFALLLAGSSARADLVSFSYNFTPGPVGGNPTSSSSYALPASSGGTVNFSNLSTYSSTVYTTGTAPAGSQSGTDVAATNITLTSGTAGATYGVNAGYQLNLTLSDGKGDTAPVTFTGNLNGSFTANASNLTNTITPGQTSQQVQMGGNTYTVTYLGFSNPGPPGAKDSNGNPIVGAISFHVEVTPTAGITKVPEPSALVLSFLGLPGLGLAAWRKRRAARAAQAV